MLRDKFSAEGTAFSLNDIRRCRNAVQVFCADPHFFCDKRQTRGEMYQESRIHFELC
jgi:hypothetical protein